MSFIGEITKGVTYAPGYFLAHGECERKTREIPQALAITTAKGAKYVPMGTIFPSNDGAAEGIVYEDVDVTTGNMPGSVVLSGVVYSNRLAVTETNYSAATPETGDNPKEKGWYEQSGSAGAYVYTLSEDTTVDGTKTYYIKTEVTISGAAKAALTAKGFTFVDSEPEVTRPDWT